MRLLFFLSLMYGMPAPSQHLRTFERVPVNQELLTGTVPVIKKLLISTVLVNNLFPEKKGHYKILLCESMFCIFLVAPLFHSNI